jgi:hypothetical protein
MNHKPTHVAPMPAMKLPLEVGLWDDDEQQIVDADGQEIGWIKEPNPTDEIANYIIKCVNHHDELVAALRELKNYVLDEYAASTPLGEAAARATEVLNKLEGDQP